MNKKLAFFLVSLLFFSGCVDQRLSAEQRQQCISLSSHSAVSVPQCSTQEECLEKVEKNFFSFNQNVFSDSVGLKLLSYKNHLARSWLYYNKALFVMKEINSACWNKEYAELPFKANEMNFALVKSFEEVDAANLDAFALLLIEAKDLESELVREISEEDLFDDFVRLNHELNELSSDGTEKDPDSLVGFYFSRAKKLRDFSEAIGFSKEYVQEVSFTDLIDFYDQDLLNKIPATNFFVPLLSKGAGEVLSFLFAQKRLERSLELLASMPTFEVLLLFNDFVGTQDSVASRLSLLLESDSLHREQALNEIEGREKSIKGLFASIESKINAIDSSHYSSLDQNFLVELFSLLEAPASLSFSGTNFSSLGSFKLEARKQLLGLSLRFNSVLEERFFGRRGFGFVLSEFKELHSSLEALNEEIDFFSSEAIESLGVLCDSRTEFIGSELSASQIPDESLFGLVELKSRIEFKLSLYPLKTNKTEKLLECRKIVELFKEFSLALEDFESYSQKKQLQSSECLSFVEKLFSSGMDLSDFVDRFRFLKSLDSESRELELLSGTCLSLKQDLKNYLYSLPEFSELNQKFTLAQMDFSLLQSISSGFPELLGSRLVSSLESKFSHISKFFKEGKLDFIVSMGLWQEIRGSLGELLLELSEAKKEAIIGFFQGNFKSLSFSDSVIELGVPFNESTKIVFSNPFTFSIKEPIAVSIPFNAGSFFVSFSSNNISDIRSNGKELMVSFSSVPLGSSVLQLDSNGLVELKEETNSIISVSSQEALLHRSLSFSSDSAVSLLRVKTELPKNLELSQARVFFNERMIDSFFSGRNLYFDLRGVESDGQADVYLSLLKPLQLSISLEESRQIDLNNSLHIYSIAITNRLPFEVKKFSLMLPVELQGGSIVSKELFDAEGKTQGFELLSNGSISLSGLSFVPGETKRFDLVLQLHNTEKYFERLLLSLEQELSLLVSSTNSEVKTNASSLAASLFSLKEGFAPSNNFWLKQLLELQKEVLELRLLDESISFSLDQFLELKQQLLNELNDFEQEILELRELGFIDYSKELFNLFSQARNLFNNALQENQSDLLLQALSLLSSKPKTDAFALIEEERAFLLQEFNSLLETGNHFLDSNSVSLKEGVFSLSESVSDSLMGNDLLNARKHLDSLSNKVLDFNSFLESSFLETAQNVYSNALYFTETISGQGVLGTLNELQSFFSSSLPESYVPPISKSRLEKIALQLGSLESSSFSQELHSFISSFPLTPFPELFQTAQSLAPQLESKNEKLFSIKAELDSALERIKEDAFTSLNSAKEFSQRFSLGQEAQNLLVKAETEAKKGNFFESIGLSKRVYFMALNAQEPEPFSVPLVAAPLVLLIVGGLYFKKRNGPKPKPKPRKQKVLREY